MSFCHFIFVRVLRLGETLCWTALWLLYQPLTDRLWQVASSVFSSTVSQFNMPPLYFYIIIPFTSNRQVKSHNHKTKVQSLPQQNILYTHLTMEKTQHAWSERKSQYDKWNRPTLTVRSAIRSLTGAKLFQEAPFRKRSIAALRTRCSQTSQPLWNEVSIAVRVQPEWLVDPRDFNKAVATSK